MLDFILETAQAFVREHGEPPDAIYINPLHFETLTRSNPELFTAGSRPALGFRLIIIPASELAHPQACLLGASGTAAGPRPGDMPPGSQGAGLGWRRRERYYPQRCPGTVDFLVNHE